MDKLCETINRQCCLHCEMECDGKWLETEIEMYKEDLLKKQSDKIADLEAKLSESERKYEDRKRFCIIENRSLTEIINNLLEENNELKQQLAEKEKEIEYQESMKILAVKNQNQTAIAELEKAKEKVLKIDKTEIKTLENGYSTLYVDRPEIITIIDQQIAELKGEKK